MTAPAPHRCRTLWRGPGQPPVCVAPEHYWVPLDPHAPSAKCCGVSAPHHHRPAVAPAPVGGAK